MHRRSSHAGQAGFTLVEMGIVLGVVAVLVALVLVGRGYIEASRQQSAAELVRTLRAGARTWSERNTGGLTYSGVSLTALPGIGSVKTPWGAAEVSVAATSAPAASCEADACVKVCVRTPSPTSCAQTSKLIANAVSVDCSTTCAGTPCLCVIAR